MTTTTLPAGTAQVAIPRRRWWLRYIIAAYLAVLVLCSVTYTLWAAYARAEHDAAFSAAVAVYHGAVAAGQMTLPAETPGASATLTRAMTSVDDVVDLPNASAHLPLSDADRAAWSARVQPQVKALAALDEVPPGAHPRLDMSSGEAERVDVASDQRIAWLAQAHCLATALEGDALLAHADRDDARAVRRLRQINTLAASMGIGRVQIVALVISGVEACAPPAVAEIAPDLDVGPAARQAPRAAVEDLIHQYLNDAPLRASFHAGLCGDAVYLDRLANTTLGHTGRLPPVMLDRARTAPVFDKLGALADVADWPDVHAAAPRWVDPHSMAGYANHFYSALAWSTDRSLLMMHRAIVARRAAAVELALRLYVIDHGRRPDTLDALVPGYLPAVPEDNFSHGAPLKYLPHAKQPCVYSVGEDGVDDGGSAAPSHSYMTATGPDWRLWLARDIVFFLDRPTYPRAPAGSPATGAASSK